jgi:hypothetical protein
MSLTCEQFDEQLGAFLEGDLDDARRRAMEQHLRECLRCASLVRDLESIRRDAASLPELAPSRDLWSGIAERIEAPVIELAPRQAGNAARGRRTWQMAAAAVVLMAASSGVTWIAANAGRSEPGAAVATAPEPTPDPAAPPSTPSNTPRIATPRPTTGGTPAALVRAEPLAPEVIYDQEITRLRAILDQRRSMLDTATVATVEKSLLAIDRAIADARTALAADASSRFLNEQLNRSLEKKLGVLRRVALLPVGAS